MHPAGPSESRSRSSAARSCATGRTRTRPRRCMRPRSPASGIWNSSPERSCPSIICSTWTRGSWRSRRGADAAWTAPRAPSSSTPLRGIALGRSPREAYERALATDRTSAFGSVIAYNVSVDRAAAEAMRDLFVEVVVAPAFAEDAVRVFQEKKNLRLVRLPVGESMGWDWKRIRGGFLAQERSRLAQVMDETRWKVMTKREPTDVEWRDLRFAWGAVGAVKSNAILLARDEAAIGIGAGQTSRVDASFLAIHKARQQGHDPKGAVLASDAFFPFPDGVEEAAHAGVGAIIQPGGSVKDAEVVAA